MSNGPPGATPDVPAAYGKRLLRRATWRLAAIALIGMACAATAWGQTFGDGTHLIGIDIAPGVYRAPGGQWCQWFRLSGLSGDVVEDAIAYGFLETNPTVEIEATDKAFKSDRCGTWELLSATLQKTAPPAIALPSLAGPDAEKYETMKMAAMAVVGTLGKLLSTTPADGHASIKQYVRDSALASLTDEAERAEGLMLLEVFEHAMDSAE